MAEQYDVTRCEKELLLQKAKRRAQLREEFLRKTTNPMQHASGEGGIVFDEGVHRFMASKVNFYDHFKANAKTTKFGVLYILVPMIGFGYLVKTRREGREHEYRTGQVAYKDRLFKFF